jgi:hypothetical protein
LRDATEVLQHSLVREGDCPFVDKSDLLGFVEERLSTRVGSAVQRLGLSQLPFQLAELPPSLIKLRLLQEPIFVDCAEEVGKSVAYRLADEILALAVEQSLLAVDVVLVL